MLTDSAVFLKAQATIERIAHGGSMQNSNPIASVAGLLQGCQHERRGNSRPTRLRNGCNIVYPGNSSTQQQ